MIVKLCGLREAENIRSAETCGADWFGFIFYPPSPRYVAERPAYLPQRGRRIGVFVRPTRAEILYRVESFGLQGVQLYEAAPSLCRELRELGLLVVAALPAGPDLQTATLPYRDCVDYFLFDTPTPGFGGSGRSWDLQQLDTYQGPHPFLLSGGLGPGSEVRLRAFHHPYWAGIDLNSRFETSPGIKDIRAVQAFISKLQNEQNP